MAGSQDPEVPRAPGPSAQLGHSLQGASRRANGNPLGTTVSTTGRPTSGNPLETAASTTSSNPLETAASTTSSNPLETTAIAISGNPLETAVTASRIRDLLSSTSSSNPLETATSTIGSNLFGTSASDTGGNPLEIAVTAFRSSKPLETAASATTNSDPLDTTASVTNSNPLETAANAANSNPLQTTARRAPPDHIGKGWYSLGVTLAAVATAIFIHYHIHAPALASAASVISQDSGGSGGSGSSSRPVMKRFAGPFDLELEKVELCEREKQGIGAAKIDWGAVTKDKDVPKRYHISGRGSFNYNTSDDLSAMFHLASWSFPGRWVTYYKNTFSGGCSMAKNFSPERWRRVSLLVFGHENADCPFPPIRLEISNFTVENKQSLLKEFIYGRWKVENQIIDTSIGNRPVSCGRTIFRVVPKKDRPMPAVVPPYDNTNKFSVELLEPPDAPP